MYLKIVFNRREKYSLICEICQIKTNSLKIMNNPTILANYQLQLDNSRPETLQRRGVINLAPKWGVKMKVVNRAQQIEDVQVFSDVAK
jgi:hypothetical protein